MANVARNDEQPAGGVRDVPAVHATDERVVQGVLSFIGPRPWRNESAVDLGIGIQVSVNPCCVARGMLMNVGRLHRL